MNNEKLILCISFLQLKQQVISQSMLVTKIYLHEFVEPSIPLRHFVLNSHFV